jgi:hypothetical protein
MGNRISVANGGAPTRAVGKGGGELIAGGRAGGAGFVRGGASEGRGKRATGVISDSPGAAAPEEGAVDDWGVFEGGWAIGSRCMRTVND